MSKIKSERVGSNILRELSDIIFNEAKDEVIKAITITAVDVTPDLSTAKVFYTYIGETTKEEMTKELKDAAGFLRTKLAERVDLRHTPELKFVYDESIAYGENIERILLNLNK